MIIIKAFSLHFYLIVQIRHLKYNKILISNIWSFHL